MPAPAFLRGETVSLHAWEEEDREFFQEHRNRPEVRRPLTDAFPRNGHQVAEHFEDDDRGGDMVFLVCAGEEAAARTGDGDALTRIGEVGIPWVNRPHDSGMLMYWATPPHQGEGHVTAATALLLDHAFGERRLNKVWAHVIEPNAPSQAVLEKLGFRREGTLRRETYYEGEYVDTYRYGLLAGEWLDRESAPD